MFQKEEEEEEACTRPYFQSNETTRYPAVIIPYFMSEILQKISQLNKRVRCFFFFFFFFSVGVV